MSIPIPASPGALKEWKEADEQAHALETELARAWDAHDKGTAPAPTEDLMERVRSQRAVAQEKLTAAVRIMGEERRAREPRNPESGGGRTS